MPGVPSALPGRSGSARTRKPDAQPYLGRSAPVAQAVTVPASLSAAARQPRAAIPMSPRLTKSLSTDWPRGFMRRSP